MKLYPKFTKVIDKGLVKNFEHKELQEISNVLYALAYTQPDTTIAELFKGRDETLHEAIYDSCRAACESLEHRST